MIQTDILLNVSTPSTDATSITWTLTPDNNCVSFSTQSDTIYATSGQIAVTAYFQNEACFGLTTITCTVVDDTGCSSSSDFTVDNICQNITGSLSVTYDAATTGLAVTCAYSNVAGTPTFDWTYDTAYFELNSQSGNSLIVTRKEGITLPDSTTFTCLLSAPNGCTEQITLDYELCAPVIQPGDFNFTCLAGLTEIADCGDATHRATVTFDSRLCTINGTTQYKDIDWSTLEITFGTSNCCFKQRTLNGVPTNVVDIYILYPPSAPDYITMTYSVADVQGYRSVPQSATSNEVITCTNTSVKTRQSSFNPKVLTTAEALIAGVSYIDVEGMVHDTSQVDWDTFTFVAATGQVLVDAYNLTAINGDAEFLPSRKIKYTVTSNTCNVDVIQFVIDDLDGNTINMAKVHIDFETYPAPSLVGDSATVVANVTKNIDILANDTGYIDPATVTIKVLPLKGSVSTNSDGSTNYIANYTEEGSDSFRYTVYSPDGAEATEAVCSITIINAGQDVTVSHCNATATVDAENLISNDGEISVTAGGSWAADAGNPSVISVVTPSALDFSAADTGIYTFTYTVTSGGETDIATLIVNYLVDGSKYVTFVNGIFTLGAGSDPNPFVLNYNIGGLASSSEVVMKVYRESSPATPPVVDDANFVETLAPTTFDAGLGTMSFTYDDAELGYTYVVRAEYYDSCGELRTVDSGSMVVA